MEQRPNKSRLVTTTQYTDVYCSDKMANSYHQIYICGYYHR